MNLHRQLLRLRRGEELIAELYKKQEMRTPTHLGIAQEAISVGVCSALVLSRDVVFTHHRSHLAYLACGGAFGELVAELYGRETGCSKGRGGSVHLTSRQNGFIASSAILGEMIAVATGAAWALKMDQKPNVAVGFFGEAACEEGIFYECLNFASIHNLPLLLICENNLYSTESPLSVRQPKDTSLCERVRSFKIAAETIDGNDVMQVQAAARLARQTALNIGPVFLEALTYRHLEHVGPNYDHDMGRKYRTEKELREWQKKCPLERSYQRLIAEGMTPLELKLLDEEICADLRDEAQAAYEAPKPKPENIMENVW